MPTIPESNSVTITVNADKSASLSSDYIGNQNDIVTITVNVAASISSSGYDAYVDFTQPDGLSYFKGPYDCSSGTFTFIIGQTDTLMMKDGYLDWQFVLGEDNDLVRTDIWLADLQRTVIKTSVDSVLPTFVPYVPAIIMLDASNVSYNGYAEGDTVTEAIDDVKNDLTNLSFTGSEHDALVTAALVDSEGVDFGTTGLGTGLNGELHKWQDRIIDIETEIDNSHISTVKGDTFATLDGRLEDIEQDHITGGLLKVDKVTGKELSDNNYDDNAVAEVAKVVLKADTSYVDTEVAAVASGSPKGVYATTAALAAAHPTGDAYIYLVTADGKWYYWNGSAWTAGGTYQSTGIADESVKKEALSLLIQDTLQNTYTAPTLTLSAGYMAIDGTVTSPENLNYNHCEIAVVAGEKYLLTGASYYDVRFYVFIDGAGNKTYYPSGSSAAYYTDLAFNSVVSGTLYVNKIKYMPTNQTIVKKLTAYTPKDAIVTKAKLSALLQSKMIPTYEEVVPTWVGGYYDRNGVLTFPGSDANFYTTITVAAGDSFLISGADYYGNVLYYFIDVFGNKSAYPATELSGQAVYKNVVFTAPYAGTLYVNKTIVMGYYLMLIQKINGYTTENNPLYLKTMYADGDSIATGGATVSGRSYIDLVGIKSQMAYIKAAVSGTTIAKRTGRTDSILERVKAITASYDYLLIQGGFNDLMTDVPIGALINGFVGALDETTVIGATESLCKAMITTYPIAKKLFVLGHRLSTGTPNFTDYPNQNTYWDAIASALEKWSIPYVDLRKSSALNGYNADWLTNYFGGANMGLHPNDNGYLYFYAPQIEAKLKTL